MLITFFSFKVFSVVLWLFTAADYTLIKLDSPVQLSEAHLDQSKCLAVYTRMVFEHFLLWKLFLDFSKRRRRRGEKRAQKNVCDIVFLTCMRSEEEEDEKGEGKKRH